MKSQNNYDIEVFIIQINIVHINVTSIQIIGQFL